jgi:chemotaxis protein MotA
MAIVQQRRAPTRRPLDIGAIALAPLGIGVIFLAQAIAGVPVLALLQMEAALIVFGGTLGALLVSYSPREIMSAIKAAGRTFFAVTDDVDALATAIIGLAVRAHRRGLMTIETEVEGVTDPFLR